MTRHQHHFEDLSPEEFERLVHWLARRSGEFDEVQWYGGARDKGRDVVAYRHAPRGEKWYIQCKRYDRITFATLRDELDKLAGHAAAEPGFAPDVVVFATACPVPPQARDQAAAYARALGLPEPYYWDRMELDERLKAQPETEEEFFGASGSDVRITTHIESVSGPVHTGSGDIHVHQEPPAHVNLRGAQVGGSVVAGNITLSGGSTFVGGRQDTERDQTTNEED